MNPYETNFIRLLASQEGGPEAIRYALTGRTLPSDSKVTAAYHAALATVAEQVRQDCLDGAGVEAVIEAIRFLERRQPYSPRRAANRPSHYWEGAEAWSEAVLAASSRLPMVCRPAELLREARFIRAYTQRAEVPVPDTGLTFVKPSGSARWILREGDDYVSFPVAWGVLSPRDVVIETVRYHDADGVEIMALLARRWKAGADRAAACERRNGVWSRWRVARDSESWELGMDATIVPSPSKVRLGDQIVDCCPVPEHPWHASERLTPARVPGRIAFDPAPISSSHGPEWTIVHFPDNVEVVWVSHPDHGRYKLELASARVVGIRQAAGRTYPPVPAGNQQD